MKEKLEKPGQKPCHQCAVMHVGFIGPLTGHHVQIDSGDGGVSPGGGGGCGCVLWRVSVSVGECSVVDAAGRDVSVQSMARRLCSQAVEPTGLP